MRKPHFHGNRNQSTQIEPSMKGPDKEKLKSLMKFLQSRQFDKVLDTSSKMLSESLITSHVYNFRGAAFSQLNKFESAVSSFESAIIIDPENAYAHCNMSNTLQLMGDLVNAAQSCQRAIEIKPNFPEAHNNLGVIKQQIGDLDGATACFYEAIKYRPNYAQAHNNLGAVKYEQGDRIGALECYKKSLLIEPENKDACINLGIFLSSNTFKCHQSSLCQVIDRMLSRGLSDEPEGLSLAIASLLKFEEPIERALKTRINPFEVNVSEIISSLTQVPLLSTIMRISPIPDFEIETLLTSVRAAILFNLKKLTETSEIISFTSALALQCFTNEYVYFKSQEEHEELAKLEEIVEKELSVSHQPRPIELLCLASYKALHEYSWSELVRIPHELDTIVKRQIRDFNEEHRLVDTIPKLKNTVSNNVSIAVRQQYEENPYPRWVICNHLKTPKSIRELVKSIKLNVNEQILPKTLAPEILVAGCGTGRHPIGSASRLEKSNVLAIDLSLASLAFAKRKTIEMGINNVSYMQADILDLSDLGKQFDVIESCGVLHHLDQPMEGWRALTNCLKQGGLMRIGLYSAIARRDIIEIRDEIKKSGVIWDHEVIPTIRKSLLESSHPHHRSVSASTDFFTMSTLRDLLFHEQEHHFTLAELKKNLAELGLAFCGFEDTKTVCEMKSQFTDYNSEFDLEEWQLFESRNPNAFANMYNFWCQKKK